MDIRSLMSRKSGGVITINPTQTIREAVVILAKHDIGALVVTDDANKLVGIISERDIVRKAVENEAIFSMTVDEVMTRRVVVGVPQDELMSVAHTMTEKRFRHMPVIDGGRLVGMISIGDVLKAQRDEYRGQMDTLETQILADEA